MANPVCIVSGSGGLIGSESVKHFVSEGYDVIGLENDMRSYFFGPEASTQGTTTKLEDSLENFRSLEIDIRDREAVEKVIRETPERLALILHPAAHPPPDGAAREPHTDFSVNA